MWSYSQSTGALLDASGKCVATGYSGRGIGLNNPAMQAVENVGPCPQGLYSIGPPHDTETHGPYVMTLTPHTLEQLSGRPGGFLIHGDEVGHVGEHLASEGCIILPPDARHAVWQSGDHVLRVTA